MTLSSGTKLGPNEILGQIGAKHAAVLHEAGPDVPNTRQLLALRSVEGEARPGRGRARSVLFLRPGELLQEPRVLLE
jgi:hypothetical protein